MNAVVFEILIQNGLDLRFNLQQVMKIALLTRTSNVFTVLSKYAFHGYDLNSQELATYAGYFGDATSVRYICQKISALHVPDARRIMFLHAATTDNADVIKFLSENFKDDRNIWEDVLYIAIDRDSSRILKFWADNPEKTPPVSASFVWHSDYSNTEKEQTLLLFMDGLEVRGFFNYKQTPNSTNSVISISPSSIFHNLFFYAIHKRKRTILERLRKFRIGSEFSNQFILEQIAIGNHELIELALKKLPNE